MGPFDRAPATMLRTGQGRSGQPFDRLRAGGGDLPQRRGGTESENSMLREFQARSTPPEIPATPSGGIPGERGEVLCVVPVPLSLCLLWGC
jgi:hypothetical protein